MERRVPMWIFMREIIPLDQKSNLIIYVLWRTRNCQIKRYFLNDRRSSSGCWMCSSLSRPLWMIPNDRRVNCDRKRSVGAQIVCDWLLNVVCILCVPSVCFFFVIFKFPNNCIKFIFIYFPRSAVAVALHFVHQVCSTQFIQLQRKWTSLTKKKKYWVPFCYLIPPSPKSKWLQFVKRI